MFVPVQRHFSTPSSAPSCLVNRRPLEGLGSSYLHSKFQPPSTTGSRAIAKTVSRCLLPSQLGRGELSKRLPYSTNGHFIVTPSFFFPAFSTWENFLSPSKTYGKVLVKLTKIPKFLVDTCKNFFFTK